MHVVLGQSSGAVGGVLVWMGLLVALTIAGGVVMIAVRKRALSRDEQSVDTGGLMDSLRAARDAGDLTEEEFRSARLRLLGMETGEGPSVRPKGSTSRVPGTADAAAPPGTSHGVSHGASQDRRAKPGFDLTGDPLPPSSE